MAGVYEMGGFDESENKNNTILSGRLIFISYQIFVTLMRKSPPFSGE